ARVDAATVHLPTSFLRGTRYHGATEQKARRGARDQHAPSTSVHSPSLNPGASQNAPRGYWTGSHRTPPGGDLTLPHARAQTCFGGAAISSPDHVAPSTPPLGSWGSSRVGPLQEGVHADAPRTHDHEPQEAKQVKRLIKLDEFVEAADRLEPHAHDGHDHVDHHWNRHQPREQPDDGEGAADAFRVGGERGVERGIRNVPTGEAFGKGVEIVKLPPSRLEKEVADEQTDQ